ncbi:hypothetical protein HMPREF9071_0269 [Capnocytophaga sp. oral taxon 338 str. F0234]|nr:hypothetical protein HMPREF9071_0269 [Capnocytophaga sp. oral taxon 338 str. F0234]
MENNLISFTLILVYYILSCFITFFFRKDRFLYFSFIVYTFFGIGFLLYVYNCYSLYDCNEFLSIMAFAMLYEPIHHILLVIAVILIVYKFIKEKK